jgi:hypothetical protein
MRIKCSRPFGILDACVLIGATCAGLALSRGCIDLVSISSIDVVTLPRSSGGASWLSARTCQNAAYFSEYIGQYFSQSWCGLAAYACQRVAFWVCPFLLMWSAAVAVLAFVPPRPPVWRLVRRPGIAACVAVIAAFAALTIALPGTLIAPTTFGGGPLAVNWPAWRIAAFFALPRTAALAVIVSWLTLAQSARWRPESTWLDRLGRALGACWICLGLIRLVASWLPVFLV